MDFVSRLILGLLLSWSFAANAQSQYWSQYPSSGITNSDPVQLCKTLYGTNREITGYQQSGSSYNCVYKSGSSYYIIGNIYPRTCTSPQQFVNGSCQVVPTCQANQEYDSSTNTCDCKSIPNAGLFMVSGDEFKGCMNGCSLTLRDGWYDKTANVTWGNWTQGGSACGVADKTVLGSTDPKVTAQKACSPGTCPGTVNGQTVCVPCDKTKQTQSTSSSTSSSSTASGATSSTTTSETDTSSSQTSCKDGSCTTTTTTTTVGPNGDKVDKTTTKTEPQSDYCTQNPKAPVCKGTESSWGGSCGSFSCDGDAVTCAIAQASWKSACAVDIDESDPKVTAGQAAMSGGDRPGDHPGNSPEQSAFSANIDQSNPFGSECPADIPLDVMGQTVAIPLSHACDSLKFMGQVAVAFAMLGAAFIVFGGIKG